MAKVELRPRQGDGSSHSGPAHVAFGTLDRLGPCDIGISWLNPQSHTPQDYCVRFAVVVAFHAATLATGRALPLTRTGLSPVGTRQLSWRTKGRNFEASLILQAVS